MLITDKEVIDSIFGEGINKTVAEVLGIQGKESYTPVQEGVIQPSWWLGWPLPKGWDDDWYGVADSVEQILEVHKEKLEDPLRNYLVTVVPIHRKDEPEKSGWRYHKWGPYIGVQNPQHEYLYDDEHIDMVLTYQIYEYTDSKKGR